MAAFLAWLGLVGTVGFGVWSVWQYFRQRLEKGLIHAQRGHLIATRDELAALTAMLNEAVGKGEIIKTNETRQLIRAIAYQLVAVQGHITAMLENLEPAAK
jgi:hypothetical protein